MAMGVSHKLKLLSGSLDGVEFSLCPGDSIFTVGATRRSQDSGMPATLAQADNGFFIPDEHRSGSFMLRVSADAQVVELKERLDGDWVPVALPLNTVVNASGLSMAVRDAATSWSSDVLEHRQALPMLEPVAEVEDIAAPRGWHRARRPIAAAALCACALVAGVLYWNQRPIAQVHTVERILAGAPHAYFVTHSRDGGVKIFADDPEGVSWAVRATQRAGREGDVVIDRRVEADRLGRALERAGLLYAVIRMELPQRPDVFLVAEGNGDADRRERARKILAAEMPYAVHIEVSSVSDVEIVNRARSDLRARGIGTRVDMQGGRASISNNAFLDDAALHVMARYRREFTQRWGDRRVLITIRLWDDVVKGRSFQYSNDQLLSVGDGRWEYLQSTN